MLLRYGIIHGDCLSRGCYFGDCIKKIEAQRYFKAVHINVIMFENAVVTERFSASFICSRPKGTPLNVNPKYHYRISRLIKLRKITRHVNLIQGEHMYLQQLVGLKVTTWRLKDIQPPNNKSTKGITPIKSAIPTSKNADYTNYEAYLVYMLKHMKIRKILRSNFNAHFPTEVKGVAVEEVQRGLRQNVSDRFWGFHVREGQCQISKEKYENPCSLLLLKEKRSFKVLECTNCHTVFDRDINAAKNVMLIALSIWSGKECYNIYKPKKKMSTGL
ncbi:hypothetical protein K501DRAFT_277609 [Backusella circina FSU 941]|nr:hypothetical protein K501DRAFT_277609 [Backusella circina FSU 941]